MSTSRFLITVAAAQQHTAAIRDIFPRTIQAQQPDLDQPDKMLFYFGLCPAGWDDQIAESLLRAGIQAEVICGGSEDGCIDPHQILIRDTLDKGMRAHLIFDSTLARIDELCLLKTGLEQFSTLAEVAAWIEGRLNQHALGNEITFQQPPTPNQTQDRPS